MKNEKTLVKGSSRTNKSDTSTLPKEELVCNHPSEARRGVGDVDYCMNCGTHVLPTYDIHVIEAQDFYMRGADE